MPTGYFARYGTETGFMRLIEPIGPIKPIEPIHANNETCRP